MQKFLIVSCAVTVTRFGQNATSEIMPESNREVNVSLT